MSVAARVAQEMCLEYGTLISTRDPHRRSLPVEDLKESDVGRLFLEGQDDTDVRLSAVGAVTSRTKFVIEDVGGRTYAVTRNHGVTLVWGRNPVFTHDSSSAYPSWRATFWLKTPTAQHPLLGDQVSLSVRYWPEGQSLPDSWDSDNEAIPLDDALKAHTRAVFRGTKEAALVSDHTQPANSHAVHSLACDLLTLSCCVCAFLLCALFRLTSSLSSHRCHSARAT